MSIFNHHFWKEMIPYSGLLIRIRKSAKCHKCKYENNIFTASLQKKAEQKGYQCLLTDFKSTQEGGSVKYSFADGNFLFLCLVLQQRRTPFLISDLLLRNGVRKVRFVIRWRRVKTSLCSRSDVSSALIRSAPLIQFPPSYPYNKGPFLRIRVCVGVLDLYTSSPHLS